jgi:hypothetical protein
MAAALFLPHSPPLSVLYADLESYALQQAVAFLGTPGAVIVRTNASGFRFYAHKYHDAEGKPRERYLAGPVGNAEADASAAGLRERIAESAELGASFRLLGREGFSVVDAKTSAVLSALHNHGVFRAGAVLVGSHAYGILLNKLGIRAAPYATEDVELARAGPLAFATPPQETLLGMLNESGLSIVEIPALDRKAPSTSFKQRGRARFRVDLLAPGRDDTLAPVPVPELGAHATSLPFLAYLLKESQPAMAMARSVCCAVRVPLPERFAVHKLITSSLRRGRDAKSGKDRQQAVVLCAALADLHPGALESALRALPRTARRHLDAALRAVREQLETSAPRAWEELRSELG